MANRLDIFVLMQLLRLSEKIEGRKRFQKMMCILRYRDKVSLSFHFRSYFYGPYSEELTSTVQALIGAGYVQEDYKEIRPGIVQYTYSLTTKGEKMAQKLFQDMENTNISEILKKFVEEVNTLPTEELVKIAKSLDLES